MYDGVGARRARDARARSTHVDARSTRARATEATRRARDRSDDSRARSISKPSKRVESNDTTMGVDASDDATSRARRVSTTSTSERRGTVMMSIAVMAVSSLMTLGIKRGVEGRGSSAFATPFKAALGQRMKHSTWDESNQHDGGNAADDGFVSYEQQRDFEGREWAWEKRISCDGHEALDFDVDAVEEGRKALWRNASFSFQFWRTPRSRHFQLYEQENIRNAFCKAGQYQVNIVTMMDHADSCEFARAHYDKGAEQFPKDASQHLGRGAFYCATRSISNFHYKLMAVCGARSMIEFNRVENLAAAVRGGQSNADYSFLNAYYADPEDFEISLINHRIFDPQLNRAYPTQFRVGCYKDGAVRRANNCQDGTAFEPRRVISTRLMGGTVAAVVKIGYGYSHLTRYWVPLQGQGERWSLDDDGLVVERRRKRAKGCVCPSDEEAMTQMAHHDALKRFLAFEENADRTIGTPKMHEYGSCHWVDFGRTKRKLVD